VLACVNFSKLSAAVPYQNETKPAIKDSKRSQNKNDD
jgi:hypothetical protein